MVQLLILFLEYPKATTCAMELTIPTGAKAVIIACYLPQPVEDHTQVCEALARLTTTLPHHLLVMGRDLHVGWVSTSRKDLQITSLPYERWIGLTTPIFTPSQQLTQATCIDHLIMWDPHHVFRHARDTQTLPSAFLDHNGVLGRLQLPILTDAAIDPLTPTPRDCLCSNTPHAPPAPGP